MTLLGDWIRTRKAGWHAKAARLERLAALTRQPAKSASELFEQRVLMESSQFVGGLEDRLSMLAADLDRLLDFHRGGFGAGGGVTNKTGKKGANPPLYQSPTELALLIDASRILYADYPKAEGLLHNVAGYVLGDGATTQIKARNKSDVELAGKAQAVCDGFADRLAWELVQEAFFVYSRRDGEHWLRTFLQDDGSTEVRVVWPEQIRQPREETQDEWGYGVHTPPDDPQKVLGYAVFPTDGEDREEWEDVPAGEMVGIKINVDPGVRRGIPDYVFGMMEALKASQKLGKNMGEASAQQAAIAFIRQHTGVKKATIEAFRSADADYTRPNYFTGTDIQVKEAVPGQIIDTNENTDFIASPYSGGIAGHLEVEKMLDRTAVVKYGGPEWLINADASSNSFANALSQEAPFLIRIKGFQRKYSRPFRTLFETVLRNAGSKGLGGLPSDILNRVEVKVTLPSPQVRDLLEEAQRAHLELADGTIDPQTVCEEAGREWDKVQRNITAAVAGGWTPPKPEPKPGEGGVTGDGGTPKPASPAPPAA